MAEKTTLKSVSICRAGYVSKSLLIVFFPLMLLFYYFFSAVIWIIFLNWILDLFSISFSLTFLSFSGLNAEYIPWFSNTQQNISAQAHRQHWGRCARGCEEVPPQVPRWPRGKWIQCFSHFRSYTRKQATNVGPVVLLCVTSRQMKPSKKIHRAEKEGAENKRPRCFEGSFIHSISVFLHA